MNNDNNPQTEQQTGANANPEGIGVVVAGPMARSVANEGAEKMDPTIEDAHWKANYSKQEYVEHDAPYTTYQPAYRTGYEGRIQCPGKKFEEVETKLRLDYEKTRGNSSLNWDKAKRAVRDAWNRVDKALSADAETPQGSSQAGELAQK